MSDRVRRRSPRWLIATRDAILIIAIGIVLLEIVLRIFDPLGISDIANQRRLWRSFVIWDRPPVGKVLPPNATLKLRGWTVRTNAQGFRDDPLNETPAADERRILLLGDSYVFGHGVDQEHLASTRIEELLRVREPAHRWEVLNTGIGSYSTHEQLFVAREWIDRLGVDAVVLLYTFNDWDPRVIRFAPSNPRPDYVPTSAVRTFGDREGLRGWIWSGAWRRELVLWVWPRLSDVWTWYRRSSDQRPGPAAERPHPSPPDWGWRLSTESLSSIQALCAERGLPFLVVYVNDYRDSPAILAQETERALADFCAKRGIAYVDMRPLAIERGLSAHRNSRVDGHPNAEGQGKLGAIVFELMLEPRLTDGGGWWLPD